MNIINKSDSKSRIHSSMTGLERQHNSISLVFFLNIMLHSANDIGLIDNVLSTNQARFTKYILNCVLRLKKRQTTPWYQRLVEENICLPWIAVFSQLSPLVLPKVQLDVRVLCLLFQLLEWV